MKRILGFTLLFNIFSFLANAQSAAVNPNADHDRMIKLILESNKVVLPDSVQRQLKKFAKDKHLDEREVLKNVVLINPLFNDKISREDKLFVCLAGIRMSDNAHSTLPVKVFNDAYTRLNKKD